MHTSHVVLQEYHFVLVLSSDTDVVALVLSHWATCQDKELKELWMKLGSGTASRYVPIPGIALHKLEICKVSNVIHYLTGSYYTSKIGTKLSGVFSDPNLYLGNFGRIKIPQNAEYKNLLKRIQMRNF